MLPDVFEEFEVVYVFLATFCFSLSLLFGKRLTLGKSGGERLQPPPPSRSTGSYGPASRATLEANTTQQTQENKIKILFSNSE